MAVHVLAVLAYKDGDRVTSGRLALSVNTNPVVIRRLLLTLQRAGLVETRKGVGSGSRLNCSPGRINLAHIYRAVEADQSFALPPKKPDLHCPVGSCIRATLGEVFSSAQKALVEDLERTTLAGILETVKFCCSEGPEPRKK
jgi:DNA-binding IscR family transcriptional regulator